MKTVFRYLFLCAALVALGSAHGERRDANAPIADAKTVVEQLKTKGVKNSFEAEELMGQLGASLRAELKSRVLRSQPGPIVNTTSGAVQGVQDTNYKLWLGIPFAQPPVGALRWQKPLPPTSWTGVKQTTWFGNSCPQDSAFTILTKTSEDCLYLNVYTPANATRGKNLPVIIFFYGGSWKFGSASFPLYWANEDISDVEDVIWVTVNYRLNIFGFLASQALKDDSSDGSVGNYGLEDQRRAMHWVRDNIYEFGGDPNLVTIQGESAGAGSVSNHLVSPPSAGLFQRAIIESGPFAVWTAQSLNTSEVKYNAFVQHSGCAASSSFVRGASSSSAVLNCLRTKSTSELMKAGKNLPNGLLEWSPVIDGVNVVGVPQKLASEGRINRVPVLLGTNFDEGTMFDNAPKSLNASEYPAYLRKRFTPELAPALLEQYPPQNYTSPWWAVSHILGDAAMTCPARRSARWLSNGPNGQPAYLYFFDHVLEVVKLFVPYKGCFHGSELVFVFDLQLGLWTKDERNLALQFVRYWTRFARYGNPNLPGQPTWPAYKEADDTLLLIKTPTPYPKSGVKNELCNFWDRTTVPHSLVWGY